jgi:hypothetical protein
MRLGISLPSDSFPLQRTCLESAGYGRLIASELDLGPIWLKRDDDPKEMKRRFTNTTVRNAIAADDDALATIYQDLYERTIDFGAHPNEKGVLTNVIKESVGTKILQFYMLAGDGPPLQYALRACAQIGICSLRIFNLVFNEQFEKHDFTHRIGLVSKPF